MILRIVENKQKLLFDLDKDLPVAVILIIILTSFLGGYFSSIYRPVYYASSTLCLILVYFLTIKFSIKKYSIQPWIFYIAYFAISGIILLILLQSIVNTYHLYFLFLTGLFLLFNIYYIPRKSLLRVTNLSFLIYLFFSILLYLDIIKIGRDLNIFDINYNILGIKTFIGLFGSTASIDSYATIIILINLYYNKGKGKWLLILVSATAALLTFRTTPFLVFFGPFIIVKCIDLFKKHLSVILLMTGAIFFLCFLPSLIWQVTHSERIILILNFLLTGRASLWILMINQYFTYPMTDLLVGFGDTLHFEVSAWGRVTANPHNMYLKILIVYGMIIFIGFYILLSSKLVKNTSTQLIILFAILLAGIGNSNIFSFMNLPLSIWFFAFLTSSRKNF